MSDRNGKMLWGERHADVEKNEWNSNETRHWMLIDFFEQRALIFVSLVLFGSEFKCGCDFTPATLTGNTAKIINELKCYDGWVWV